MDFATALKQIQSGNRMARTAWTDSDPACVFMVPGSEFKVNRPPLLGIFEEGHPITYHPHIDAIALDGSVFVWTPTQRDMFATDWEFLR